ncbi:MAG: DNA-processing protein DprA [Mangrovibacterium sp.]
MIADEHCCLIALSLTPGVGAVNARRLVDYFGSARAVFEAGEALRMKVPGIGMVTARKIGNREAFKRAETELAFLERHRIRALYLPDHGYPERLRQCEDAPLVLYCKGTHALQDVKMVAVVGTRHASERGRDFCDKLVAGMAGRGGYCVVSGLAYGIDVAAHKACLKYGVPTIGVLGHGLDRIYPSPHRQLAAKMLEAGALVTDFVSQTEIERQNFLRRNRIIGGLVDAVIIVESAEKGGALVTADLAQSYNRDVFAVPGRISDCYSRGCNALIKYQKAGLLENLDDLEYFMSWQPEVDSPGAIQIPLFPKLSPAGQKIADLLRGRKLSVDELAQEIHLPAGQLASLLLELEFSGVLSCLPGKIYRLRNE